MSGRIRVQKLVCRWWCLAGYLSVSAPTWEVAQAAADMIVRSRRGGHDAVL